MDTKKLMDSVAELVEGVEVDLDETLPTYDREMLDEEFAHQMNLELNKPDLDDDTDD